MAFHDTNPTITYDSTSAKYHIKYDGKTIVTTITDKAAVAEEWVNEILLLHANTPTMVVGLDVEWRPHAISYMSNKSATLQLCIDSSTPSIEVDEDIKKLKNEYGLDCAKSADIREVAKKKWPGRFRRPGLKDLASEVAGIHMKKPKHVCMSNWEARVLNESQVEYACVDAYASYKIAYKLFFSD
ncbi:hypothetical protein L2E82_13967 [Cichorium intybus]|uniref:Uncharacterized protein n=1 Tax=Cichorium intybus TaxID=13427 RepID=A0ACB9EYP2_CICIN|nr:hypothetical protein L2E82_13967 [Cichorium intybus]